MMMRLMRLIICSPKKEDTLKRAMIAVDQLSRATTRTTTRTTATTRAAAAAEREREREVAAECDI